jgi:hypothetical protein
MRRGVRRVVPSKLQSHRRSIGQPNPRARDARGVLTPPHPARLGESVAAAFDIGDQAAQVRVELVEMEFECFEAAVHEDARGFGGFERVLEARDDVGRGGRKILAGSACHLHSAFRGRRTRALEIRRIATGDFSARDENLPSGDNRLRMRL